MNADTTQLKVLPVFYSDLMIAEAESYSPSAAKPKAVVESWQNCGVPIKVIAPEPIQIDDFKLAHDPDFVDAILQGRKKNGFGNKSESVAKSLAYTTGAMLAAAKEALQNRLVAAAPCSGFHHAHYDHCGGFCTFNGLIVTAQELHRNYAIQQVGILDFDMHYGDGTADCIRQLNLDWIVHRTAGDTYTSPSQAAEFLARIPAWIEQMKDCEIVLYQAGADPHINDPLGGWLDDAQLRQRDHLVFKHAKLHGIPIAWNLAGGYQKPLRKVLNIHDETLKECWRVYGADAR